jgi:voltage-gated potassium channel
MNQDAQSVSAVWTAKARALWSKLRSEDIPRLVVYNVIALVVGGLLVLRLESGRNDAFKTVEDGLWWSLVTLTTIGYGDKFPVTTGGRLVAAVVLLFGLGMVGIVTGKIASILVEKKIKEGRGLSDAMHVTGHCVILGWKSDMHLLVQEILTVNPELSPQLLVLVNGADELLNNDLRDRFPGLVYIQGELTDPLVLQRTHLTHAAKVIILADQSGSRTDQEVDARTVMAAMTTKSMAPDVYTVAEILDKTYYEHLQLARCDEIILSREYSRFLLVSATRSAGITHVLHDLLDVTDMVGLATLPVPPEFVGQPVRALAASLRKQKRMLIGLLENTGRARTIKREALREAQKTANMSTLVDNLRRVKELQPNRPHLSPPDDYIVPKHALAIVIGHTGEDAA